MAEVEDRKPKLRPIGTDRSPTDFLKAIEKSQRHFLGLYKEARICAGTDDSRAGMITTTCGKNMVKEKTKRWPIRWNKIISFSLGGGGAGASVGVSTGFPITSKKERQFPI
jgi:hypothetical protein